MVYFSFPELVYFYLPVDNNARSPDFIGRQTADGGVDTVLVTEIYMSRKRDNVASGLQMFFYFNPKKSDSVLTIKLSGTSFLTILEGPINTFSPTSMSPIIIAFSLMCTLSFIVGGA